MEAKAGIWYRLGYAWETARMGSAAANGEGSGPGRRLVRSGNGSAPSGARKTASSLLWGNLLGEAGGLARRAVGRRARPASRGDLPRAALAGAGAALAARALGSLLADDASSGDDPGLGLELVQGAAEGLALGVLSRHLPGGRVLQMGLCGAARYAAAPRGGLPRVIRPIAPPTVRTLSALAPEGRHEPGLVEHAAFAAAFVLLYRWGTPGTD